MQLYEKPVPENDFVQHCIQRRKYPVLLKVKFLIHSVLDAEIKYSCGVHIISKKESYFLQCNAMSMLFLEGLITEGQANIKFSHSSGVMVAKVPS